MKKNACSLLLALFFIAGSCKEPGGPADDEFYKNPNAGFSREFAFSHNSGLYSQKFSLAITAPPGSDIYYSTDGSVPSPEKAGSGFVHKYSGPITVQNRNGQANILATPENSRQMYMVPESEGGDREWPQAVYIPNAGQVPKATVIRAIAVDSGGSQSGVLTRTYFIGSNLADYAGNRVISLVTDPKNLVDKDYGIMVRGADGNMWYTSPPYNFLMRGFDWEREAHMEIFEGNAGSRSVKLSTGVGIRVRGGWSRGTGQKSLSVYFREEYGMNNLRNYELIPGAFKAGGKIPVERYKGFMLRNGGSEIEYTKFYDVFIQDLLSDRSFTTQAAVPCVVYLNGEYWGPYNLQERYSDNHTEYKYGVKKENVISYDNGELDDGLPEDAALYRQMIDMRNRDMSVPQNYSDFCDVFDIDNFIDYFAAEIYIYNEDWPHNNYRLWRVRDEEPDNPYGDQKWRWQMFDTEFALGVYNNGGIKGSADKDAFDKILNGDSNNLQNHPNNRLFKALLANEDFCRRFVNTMLDLYNVNFHPGSFGPKLNDYAAVYRPLMDGYFARWGYPGGTWTTVFQNKVNDARNYLNEIRDPMVYDYLPAYFGGYPGIANTGISAGGLYNVTLSAAGAYGVPVKINTVTLDSALGSWTGKYYSGNPVTVTAGAPPDGFEFDGWTVTGGSALSPSELSTSVNVTGNALLKAVYRLKESPAVPVTGITLNAASLSLTTIETYNLISSVTPPNATYSAVFWESDNPGAATVDMNGKVSGTGAGTAVITASTAEGLKASCTVNVKEAEVTVLLDLAGKLKTLTPRAITTQTQFNTAFGNFPVRSGGGIGTDVTYAIITENGVNKLQVNDFALWAPGLDVINIIFKAGDKIDIKGTYISGPSNGIAVNSYAWDWDPLQNWNLWCANGQVFQKTFTLTEEDAATINANAIKCNGAAIRIKTGGLEPWSGINPAGIGKYAIEQIKIYGHRQNR
ncbi:MAG: CotH kinase family protein [Treponema sp.]|nr:CotH kinase family protein [Treponema sp.]